MTDMMRHLTRDEVLAIARLQWRELQLAGEDPDADITKMRPRRGEPEWDFWARKVMADPGVILTEDGVYTVRRKDQDKEEYTARSAAASPPLSDDAKAAIRAAADEYWAIVRERRTA